jgi:hypothetical protein
VSALVYITVVEGLSFVGRVADCVCIPVVSGVTAGRRALGREGINKQGLVERDAGMVAAKSSCGAALVANDGFAA